MLVGVFFFNDTATTEIYTLSLHDALPILLMPHDARAGKRAATLAYGAEVVDFDRYREDRETLTAQHAERRGLPVVHPYEDRKSTRLNSSHANISYAAFRLHKQNT